MGENINKIAVIGSHGTGKTSLVNMISHKLGYNIIPDIVREFFNEGYEINEQTTAETQLQILERQTKLEKEVPQPWVSDKSIYDNLVYAKVGKQSNELINIILDKIALREKYDLIFYLPIEFPLEKDGIRSNDESYQKEIDMCFREMIVGGLINAVSLSGSLEERFKKVIKIIKK